MSQETAFLFWMLILCNYLSFCAYEFDEGNSKQEMSMLLEWIVRKVIIGKEDTPSIQLVLNTDLEKFPESY